MKLTPFFFLLFLAASVNGCGSVSGSPQGQRTLNLLCVKDLQQEVVVPAGDFAFAFDAVFRGVLLQQADRKTSQPG